MSDSPQEGKLTAAKALFIGFFAAALGWAGVLIAAVAVATEQTWSDSRGERDRSRSRGRSWLDTQRSWLEQDHRDRMARAQARQSWLDSGAPADTEPASLPQSRRLKNSLRRPVANVAVAGSDFRDNFRQGWKEADQVRRDGGNFRDIAGSRPHRHTPGQECPNCGQPTPEPRPTPQDTPPSPASTPRRGQTTIPPKPSSTQRKPESVPDPIRRLQDENDVFHKDPKVRPDGTVEPGQGFPRHGACGRCHTVGSLTAVGWCEPCLLAAPHGFCHACNGLMVNAGDGIYRHGPHQGCTATAKSRPPRREGIGGEYPAGFSSGLSKSQPLSIEQARALGEQATDAINRSDWAAADKALTALQHGNYDIYRNSSIGGDHGTWDLFQWHNTVRRELKKQEKNSEGDTMPEATDSNATVLAGKLGTINTTVTAVAGDVDHLAVVTQELRTKIVRASDLAHSAGMPTEAVNAVDAVQAAAAAIDARLDDFAAATAAAGDQLTAAATGLNAVKQAEDKLHAAGADGRALDTTVA